jgi:dTDP-glucose 4,6-dehydratase
MDTVTKILTLIEKDIETSLDFSYSREGQDVRYALDDSKLRSLGWTPKKIFDEELPDIVKYYKQNFIW